MGHWESCSKGKEPAGKCGTVWPGRSFVQRVSGIGVRTCLGADSKVSCCLISLFYLQSLSLLYVCLWPFL